ncbi:hypothetical protein I317_00162 [Kwoniella heveanensis CBS 569]|uniref:Uncharacterized protein n=1 Tax=Kwoniella heveanensis BCC8398 TaxID=1296120 RepID=A0A1B9H1G2_9TREE|nr:hypothetical protein I316_01023 [Kwoniella heveanensis BCC8398]OCF46072.1 hypothetical protein I317_00162 [Kwoniella heveanensis CBS 569]
MAAPQYLGPAGSQPSNPLSAFWKNQVVNPEHREGNINIARATAIFVLGVVFVRSGLSSALVPVF